MTWPIITLHGANGDTLPLSGPGSDEGYKIMRKGFVGYFDAATTTEWTRARRERGGRYKGMEQSEREIEIPFRVTSDREWADLDSRLAKAIPYELDRWDEDARLARLEIETPDSLRWIDVQRSRDPQYSPELDAVKALQLGEGIVTYFLKAANPMWASAPTVTSWETGSTSGSGTITISNPTDQPMYHEWVLTPGTWTVPDPEWGGPEGRRVIRHQRDIELRPNTSGLRISLDPMARMFRDMEGINVAGQVAAGYWLLHEIPPHTPPTDLPISVTDAPSGGARAELHQPRLWSRPWGLE